MKKITKEEILEDGTKKISTYDANSQEVIGYYHLNKQGKKHGEELIRTATNRLSEKETLNKYDNGKIVESDTYTRDVTSMVFEEVQFTHMAVNGTSYSKTTQYYKQHQDVVEDWTCETKDGKRNGLYTDRINFVSAHYKDNKLDGSYVKFFDQLDGKKEFEGSYINGKKNGVWKYYDNKGNVINTEYWRNGKNETEKFNAIKKVAAKHVSEEGDKIAPRKPKITKAIEVLQEIKSSKKTK